jgi:hypothetical protein
MTEDEERSGRNDKKGTRSKIMKPRLLLHACCGVCSAYVPEKLIPDFDVTVYYENSNIFPEEEFYKRQTAAKTMAEKFGLPFVEPTYSPTSWFKSIVGCEQEHEGGPRCEHCINFRLSETVKFAKQNGFEWVATTLSVSRTKNIDQINRIGHALAEMHGLKFLGEDWKKGNGEVISQQRAKETGIYRQNYCGCVYSMTDKLKTDQRLKTKDGGQKIK